MKVRQGFVSNSSSASFIIALSKLTPDQLKIITEYGKPPINPALHCKWGLDYWEFEVDERRGLLVGSTYMDNGDLAFFLEKCGMGELFIIYSEGG